MFAHRTLRRCLPAAAAFCMIACGEQPTHPTSGLRTSAGNPGPSVSSPVSGVANPAADQATLAALRAPWAWIGSVHHEAMQEILHDAHVSEYTGRGPDSPGCAAQIRYMTRYAQRISVIVDSLNTPGRDEPVDVNALGLRVGVCTIMPTRVVAPATPLASYAMSLATSLQSATTPADARRAIDAVLLNASHDPSLSARDLSAVAALTVVALSSTTEWYTLSTQTAAQRPAAATSRTLASWSAAAGNDLIGCGSADSVLGCAIGSIGGSLLGW